MVVLIQSACSKTKNSFDVESIKVSVVNTSKLGNGTYYTLQLHNTSKQSIKHIDVYFGYALSEKGRGENNISSFVIPAKPEESAINISSGEKRNFTVFWPSHIFQEDMFDMNKANFHIIGYMREIDIQSRFEKNGGLQFFSIDEQD